MNAPKRRHAADVLIEAIANREQQEKLVDALCQRLEQRQVARVFEAYRRLNRIFKLSQDLIVGERRHWIVITPTDQHPTVPVSLYGELERAVMNYQDWRDEQYLIAYQKQQIKQAQK